MLSKDNCVLYCTVYRLFLWIVCGLVLTSCGTSIKGYDPNRKIPPHFLREDFTILRKTLEENHPSLYWYTTPDSLEAAHQSIYHQLNDSLTEAAFRRKVSWWVSKIHCGHTSTRLSNKYQKYYKNRKMPQFPLQVKVWGDSAIFLSSLRKQDSLIKRGDIILSINGIPMKSLVDSMCAFLSTDGYSDNFKYQAISFNFPAHYQNAFGLDSQYVVAYIDAAGIQKSHITKNFVPVQDSTRKPVIAVTGPPPAPKPKKEDKLLSSRSLRIDTLKHIAYMDVNTFSKGHLRKFFRKSFKTLQQQQVKNLVVDLRRNTGGSVAVSTLFSRYMVKEPFRIADTVAAVKRSLPNRKYISHWLLCWLSLNIIGRKSPDGRIHFRFLERDVHRPVARNHFDGNIYLLTGGYTFSASTFVVHTLQHQSNVTVLGEETGGGAYGNSAIYIPDIVLPNSRIKVRLPLFRVVLDSGATKNGRGIIPDIVVPPNSSYIRRGIDAKLEKVRQLIETAK